MPKDASPSSTTISREPVVATSRYRNFVRWYMRQDIAAQFLHFIHLRYRHLLTQEEIRSLSFPQNIVCDRAESASAPVSDVPSTSHSIAGLTIATASINQADGEASTAFYVTETSPLLVDRSAAAASAKSSKSKRIDPSKHIFLSGRAIPLHDLAALEHAIILDGVRLGVDDYVNVLIPTTFYALLAHDLISHFAYPQDRYGNVLWRIFAGVATNQQTFTSYLINSYRNPFWCWSILLLLAPILTGSYQAIRRYIWDFPDYSVDHIESDILGLRNYTSLIEANTVKELLARFSPVPVTNIFDQIDRLALYTLWHRPTPYNDVPSLADASVQARLASRLADQHDHDPLDNLIRFARKDRLIPQLYVLSRLADIVDSRSPKIIAQLRTALVDPEVLTILQQQRTEILSVLEQYAHYRLARTEGNNPRISPSVIRFFYVNHLLWQIGHGRRAYLDPLFWSYNLGKDLVLLYAQLRTLYAVGMYSYEIIEWWLNRHHCHQEHKVWNYIAAKARYECSVCGNWRDIYYANMFAPQACLDAVLAKPRSAAEVLTLMQQMAPFNYSRLDFSRQNWTEWNSTIFWQILNNVTVSPVSNSTRNALVELNLANGLGTISPEHSPSILPEHAQILGDFLTKMSVRQLNLRGYALDANASSLLFPDASVLPDASFLEVDLSYNPEATEALPVILELLPNTTQTLRLSGNHLTDQDMQQIAPFFAHFDALEILDLANNTFGVSGLNTMVDYLGSQVRVIDLSQCNLTQSDLSYFGEYLANSTLVTLTMRSVQLDDQSLMSLLPYIADSQLRYLDVSHNFLAQESACALLGVLKQSQISHLLYADNQLEFMGTTYLANALVNSSVVHLDISGNNCGDSGLQQLCRVLPFTKVSWLNISDNELRANGIACLASVLPQGKLRFLDVSTNKLSDSGISILGSLLPQLGNSSLSLSCADNAITFHGALKFSASIANNSLAALDISHNVFQDNGMLALLQALNGSSIRQLRAAHCQFTNISGELLAEILPTTQLQEVDVSGNALGDDVAVKMAGALISQVPHQDSLGQIHLSRDQLRAIAGANATTFLHGVGLNSTNISTIGARALCRVVSSAGIDDPAALSMQGNAIDPNQLDLTTCVVSAGSKLQPFYLYSPSLAAVHSKNLFVNGMSSLHHAQNYELLHICMDVLPADVARQMLSHVLAIALALRQEIGAKIMPYLPQIVRGTILRQLSGAGGELLTITSEIFVRAQVSGINALLYDATYITKIAYQKHQSKAPKETSDKSAAQQENAQSIAIGTVAGLLTLGSVYGLAKAVTYASGSIVLGALMPSLALNARKVVNRVTSAYQRHGFFAALDAGVEAVVFSFPGGSLIERSLQQQHAAIERDALCQTTSSLS